MTENAPTNAADGGLAAASAPAAGSGADAHSGEGVEAALSEVEQQMGVLAGQIRASIRTSALAIDPALQPFGLKMLRQLANSGPMHASRLAEVLFVDRSIISRQTKQLHEMGLVEMQTDPDDGRARYVAATPLALERMAAARADDKIMLHAQMSTWSVSDLKQFAGFLKRLTESAPQ